MTGFLTADYDFALPPDRIAQTPVEPRGACRLMVVDRTSGSITHRRFSDLVELIAPGDVLVLNRTRVRRARLLGTRAISGAPAEILLLKPLGDNRYEAMVSPGGKLKPGRIVDIAPGFTVEILEITDRRTRVVRLVSDRPVDEAVEQFGHLPLPPYIARADEPGDTERYQTVYARELGSVAAPTAGLHFTPELLTAIEQHGVGRADILLHVGAGTFKPSGRLRIPSAHQMHEEWYAISDRRRRIRHQRAARAPKADHTWAVGTTTVRTMETARPTRTGAVQLPGWRRRTTPSSFDHPTGFAPLTESSPISICHGRHC